MKGEYLTLTQKALDTISIHAPAQNIILQAIKRAFARSEEPLTTREIHELSKDENKIELTTTRSHVSDLKKAGFLKVVKRIDT